MILRISGHDFAYEMECVARIFFPGEQIDIVKDFDFTCKKHDRNVIAIKIEPLGDNNYNLTASVSLYDFDKSLSEKIPRSLRENNSECERKLALMLFDLLSEMTGRRPKWGILTGIRPVRLCGQWASQGLTQSEIFDRLTKDYLVSEAKAGLCLETGSNQLKYLELNKPDTFSLYVGIPFCPTRCHYCSFVSHDIAKSAKLVPDYVRLLCEEIRHTGRLASELGLKLLTVYIGGGTPTTLSPEQLSLILSEIDASFDMSHLLEYTVESGRPDTVTHEKLAVLRDFNVGRISINPQTMNDNVLKSIGRAHSSKQIEESYMLAREMGFKSINMDLITGLPDDTFESFCESLEKVIGFTPENITIHALTIKRSAHLREKENAFLSGNPDIVKTQDFTANRLKSAGYFPYYLYRQKATVENLENIGFSNPDHEGIYNIYSMDDMHNILAVGAGAVSKLLSESGIRRIFNYKYPYEYISRFDEILKRKTEETHARYH